MAEALDLEATLLLASDEVPDLLAVVGVAAGVDLGGNPRILLLGNMYSCRHVCMLAAVRYVTEKTQVSFV